MEVTTVMGPCGPDVPSESRSVVRSAQESTGEETGRSTTGRTETLSRTYCIRTTAYGSVSETDRGERSTPEQGVPSRLRRVE